MATKKKVPYPPGLKKWTKDMERWGLKVERQIIRLLAEAGIPKPPGGGVKPPPPPP